MELKYAAVGGLEAHKFGVEQGFLNALKKFSSDIELDEDLKKNYGFTQEDISGQTGTSQEETNTLLSQVIALLALDKSRIPNTITDKSIPKFQQRDPFSLLEINDPNRPDLVKEKQIKISPSPYVNITSLSELLKVKPTGNVSLILYNRQKNKLLAELKIKQQKQTTLTAATALEAKNKSPFGQYNITRATLLSQITVWKKLYQSALTKKIRGKGLNQHKQQLAIKLKKHNTAVWNYYQYLNKQRSRGLTQDIKSDAQKRYTRKLYRPIYT